MTDFSLHDLEQRIAGRVRTDAAKSYTRSLLDKGVVHCAKKLSEEVFETSVAAIQEDKSRVVAETADLLYHLLVLLHARGVTMAEVEAELDRRTAQGGHEEKASRPQAST